MAKAPLGILGPTSGKVGPIITSSWKGIPYIRSKGKKRNKRKARTPAQIAAMGTFNYLNKWLSPFTTYIQVGLANKAVGKTELNVAYTENYYGALLGSYPALSMDYSKVCFSAGVLPGLEQALVERTPEGTVSISWSVAYQEGTDYTDQVILIVYEFEGKMVEGQVALAQRGQGTCSYQLSELMSGKPVQVFVFVAMVNRKEVSDTQYLGELLP